MKTKKAKKAKTKADDYNRKNDTFVRLAKLRRKLGEEADDLDELDEAGLRARIVEAQTYLVETLREMGADKDLADARQNLEQVLGPYKDAKARLTAVTAYCTLRLDDADADADADAEDEP